MEMTQIAQSLRAQMLQQGGVSAAQLNQLMASGCSFADIIMMMLANTQTGADLNALMSDGEGLFGEGQFPVIPGESKLNNSDFSENLFNIDPAQLSGLFGFVMTGNQLSSDNNILNSICDEMTSGTSFDSNNMNAYDFVNKYIENGELEIISYKTAQNNSSATGSETSSGDGEDVMDFINMMREARNNLAGAKNVKDVEPAEIGALQTEAERLDIRFEQINSEIKMKNEFESPENQLLKGVAENLKQGNNEFTVKLKPEGLGEIIVKLVQNDGGKMLMSMTASSAKTAELLNSNLSSLQSSLSQHNVEIVNPNDMTNTVSAMESAFEHFYHDGGQQQRNPEQQLYSQNQGFNMYSEVDDAETFDVKASAAVGDDGLNIRI